MSRTRLLLPRCGRISNHASRWLRRLNRAPSWPAGLLAATPCHGYGPMSPLSPPIKTGARCNTCFQQARHSTMPPKTYSAGSESLEDLYSGCTVHGMSHLSQRWPRHAAYGKAGGASTFGSVQTNLDLSAGVLGSLCQDDRIASPKCDARPPCKCRYVAGFAVRRIHH